jgi:hypothetical protein
MHVEVFRRVDATLRDRLATAFRDALTAYADDTGVHFDSPYVVVTATRR